MYIRFDVLHQSELDSLKDLIQHWAQQHDVHYTQKTIKTHHRLAFNRDRDFTLFFMTWSGPDYQVINVGNETY